MTLSLLIDRLLIVTLFPLGYPIWWLMVYIEGHDELGRPPSFAETTWVLHVSMVALWRGES